MTNSFQRQWKRKQKHTHSHSRDLYDGSLSKLDDFMNQLYKIYLKVKQEGVAQVKKKKKQRRKRGEDIQVDKIDSKSWYSS